MLQEKVDYLPLKISPLSFLIKGFFKTLLRIHQILKLTQFIYREQGEFPTKVKAAASFSPQIEQAKFEATTPRHSPFHSSRRGLLRGGGGGKQRCDSHTCVFGGCVGKTLSSVSYVRNLARVTRGTPVCPNGRRCSSQPSCANPQRRSPAWRGEAEPPRRRGPTLPRSTSSTADSSSRRPPPNLTFPTWRRTAPLRCHRPSPTGASSESGGAGAPGEAASEGAEAGLPRRRARRRAAAERPPERRRRRGEEAARLRCPRPPQALGCWRGSGEGGRAAAGEPRPPPPHLSRSRWPRRRGGRATSGCRRRRRAPGSRPACPSRPPRSAAASRGGGGAGQGQRWDW